MDTKREYQIGDVIPLDQAEKSDTFFLVIFAGKKYLVDQTGKVILKHSPTSAIFSAVDEDGGLPRVPTPEDAPLKFRVRPGTVEFMTAVQEAESVMLSFVDLVRRTYPHLAPRFEAYLENTRSPYIKYFQRGKEGLANIKAYLIREFFTRTHADERGLEIVEFLPSFISRRMNGAFSRDRQYSPAEQQALLFGLLTFAGELGDPLPDVVADEYRLLEECGAADRYVPASLARALAGQQKKLARPANREELAAASRRLIDAANDFFLDNMLAYLKGLIILQLLSDPHHQGDAADIAGDERLFYAIIAYHPSWYH